MKRLNEPLDIIDFHAHILPGADHGSTSLEVSELQIKYAAENGVKRIIATPHFYPHKHLLDDFLKRRDKSLKALLPLLPSYGVDVKLGAELLLCEGINRLPGIDNLCINGTRTLLAEFPFVSLEKRHFRMVESLVEDGFNVIIAHAERYERSFIDSLLPLNISLQLNSSSLCKFRAMRRFSSWFTKGSVSALGSDIHGPDEKAYKKFLKACLIANQYTDSIKNKSNEIWNK